MPQDDKGCVQRGSSEHKKALERLNRAAKNAGNRQDEFLEAVDALRSLQGRIDWQAAEGIVESEGVGRALAVQVLDNCFCRVPSASGVFRDWKALKEGLVSRPYSAKEEADYFLLSRFYDDGFEKQSFDKNPVGKSSFGISRCNENVQWIDGLTLDFDSGLTPDEFCDSFSGYEFLLYSSYNHDRR